MLEVFLFKISFDSWFSLATLFLLLLHRENGKKLSLFSFKFFFLATTYISPHLPAICFSALNMSSQIKLKTWIYCTAPCHTEHSEQWKTGNSKWEREVFLFLLKVKKKKPKRNETKIINKHGKQVELCSVMREMIH